MLRIFASMALPAAVCAGLAAGMTPAAAADPPAKARSSSPVGLEATYTAEPATAAPATAAPVVRSAPAHPSTSVRPSAAGGAAAPSGLVRAPAEPAGESFNGGGPVGENSVQIEGDTQIRASSSQMEIHAVGSDNASCAHIGSIGGGKC